MCVQISRFPRWPCSNRRRSTVEVSSRSLAASLLASSASYFLISWQKPFRFFATTVEYFLEYFRFFMASTFSGAKVFSPWTFCRLWYMIILIDRAVHTVFSTHTHAHTHTHTHTNTQTHKHTNTHSVVYSIMALTECIDPQICNQISILSLLHWVYKYWKYTDIKPFRTG